MAMASGARSRRASPLPSWTISKPLMRLLLALPVVTLLCFLWFDEFNLLGAGKASRAVAASFARSANSLVGSSLGATAASGSASSSDASTASPAENPGGAEDLADSSSSGSDFSQQEEKTEGTEGPEGQEAGSKPSRLVLDTSHEAKYCRKASQKALSVPATRKGKIPKVAFSLAVHPPKFHAASKWLSQYSKCAGALAAASVYVVFSSEAEVRLFREGLACLYPDIPQDAWVPVVMLPPKQQRQAQILAGYKKWTGIMHMLDLPESPDFGVMVDAELLIFENSGNDGPAGAACAIDGPWSQLHRRLLAKEESKVIPAARVSNSHTSYKQGSRTMTGFIYDQALMKENANWLRFDGRSCSSAKCHEVDAALKQTLFSWWTDLPYLNLTIAARLIKTVAEGQKLVKQGSWVELLQPMRMTRFEMLGYHYWCILHEGFSFKDVTNLTGEAKWGSYLEDPPANARLDLLEPIWVSGHAMEYMEDGIIPNFSKSNPPLLIYHADKGRSRAKREQNRENWKMVMKKLLHLYGDDQGWSRMRLYEEDW